MLRLQVTLGLFGGTDRPNKIYIVILLFSEDKYVTCKQYDYMYLVKSKIKKLRLSKSTINHPLIIIIVKYNVISGCFILF